MNEWNDIAVISPAHDIDISTVGELRDQIDEVLADLEAEGILAALQDKWFDNKGDYDVGTAPDASAPSWTSTPAPMLRRFATSRMTKSPATSRTS